MGNLRRYASWGVGILLLFASQSIRASENPRGAPVRHLHRVGAQPSQAPPQLLLPQVDQVSPESFREFPCLLGEHSESLGLLSNREDVRRRLDMMRSGDYAGLLKEITSPPARVEPDTFRILVIRVDFLEDSGGDESTTPDGRFDLRSNDEAQMAIDPPPHNKAYFESHMEALRRYYWHQSGGSLYLDYDVFPAESDSAYHLSDTGDYGPWIISVDNPDLLALAEKFVTDAIVTADTTDPAVDYGAYDSFLIFHSGADFQGDIERDTPYDIPSFNLFLSDPVAVEDSTVFLNLIMVVPETVSQDDFLGGLNGVVTHEFGHQLGFLDLYNVYTFFPVVGMFSLMDSGDNTFGTVFDPYRDEFVFVRGALPSSVDPWHKYIFFGPSAAWNGFRFPELVEPGEVTVEPSIVSREIPLVPLNLQEWYLIENRPFDLNGDRTVILRADSLTGVILGPDHDDTPDDTLATLEYDYLLPGEGLLIWHIDWEAINEGLSSFGGVNVIPGRRGVSVVEADGIPDLGDIYSPEWTGGPYDYWFSGGFTRLGPDTDPASNSSHGTSTFINIEVLDPPQNSMRFRWSRGWVRANWPSAGFGPIGTGGVLAVDIGGDQAKEILAASGPGIAAWSADGSRLINASGDPFWAAAEGNLTGALAWNPSYSWGTGATGAAAAISREGQLHLWRSSGSSDGARRPALVWPDSVTASREPRVVATSPVLLDSVVLVGGEDGRIRALRPGVDSDPALQWRLEPRGGPINSLGAGDLNEDGIFEYFWVTEGGQVGWTSGPQTGPVRLGSGWARILDGQVPVTDVLGAVARPEYGPKGDPGGLWTVDALGRLRKWPLDEGGIAEEPSLDLDLGESPAGPLALGDLDGDGQLEIVVSMASGRVNVLALDGSPEPYWPSDLWSPDSEPPGPLTAPPLVLPPIEDRVGILFQPRPRGDVAALDHDGKPLDGWPQTFGFEVSSLWLGDIEDDGDMEVVAGDVRGFITLMDVPLPWADGRGMWSLAGGTTARSRFLDGGMVPEPVTAPGSLSEKDLRIYPNPIRGAEAILDVPITAPAKVRLEAVDAEGRQVREWEWAAIGGPDGERLALDVVDLAPGFYLCRIFVEGEGTSISTLRKIAVVR